MIEDPLHSTEYSESETEKDIAAAITAVAIMAFAAWIALGVIVIGIGAVLRAVLP